MPIKKSYKVGWDFFYDEGAGGPYDSLDDWCRDIHHLVLPLIIMVDMGMSIYFIVELFLI
ncbi:MULTISPECIES: hypothetical protein [unclassified Flagellimonas]|uniref:Uncharacterized protein n=1 Tax=Flagellimonas sp. MMG031 TaxID=3158549 RepID=A0AAU7N0Q9_9FLAO